MKTERPDVSKVRGIVDKIAVRSKTKLLVQHLNAANSAKGKKTSTLLVLDYQIWLFF